MGWLQVSCFLTGTCRVLPLTCFYIPKSAKAYLFPQSVNIYCFCSGPISVDSICPQPAQVHPWHRLAEVFPAERRIYISFLYIYICIYICMYIHMYICLSISLSLYTYIYIYIHLSISLSLSLYIYICLFIYTPQVHPWHRLAEMLPAERRGRQCLHKGERHYIIGTFRGSISISISVSISEY